MATVTPNFNWPVPTSTDLVKDGATAIEALGDSIDASLVDLKGGTTGQVLSKTSGTDMDFTWVTTDDANAIQNSIVDAKGDLIAASANDTPARLAVGNNGETLVADSSTSTGLRYQAAKVVNAIYNSSFDIWQRGTTAAISVSANYIADRWRYYRATTGSTGSRSTDVPTGFTYSAKTQRDSGNTATNDIYIGQGLENVDSVRFVGQTVTLSYWAKAGANFSGASSQIYAQIQTGSGTNQAIFDFSVLQNLGGLQTITTTWTKYTVTGTVSGSATQIGVRFYYTPVGTAGADDSFFVTGVQLEVGSVPTIYSKLGGSIQGELAACQRYYFRNTPGTNYGIVATGGVCFSTTTVLFGLNLPVQMRVYPTSADFGNLQVFDSGNSTYAISAVGLSALNSGPNLAGFEITATGLTVGRPCVLRQNNNAAGFIGFSAEL
jgi:hypothetical protein